MGGGQSSSGPIYENWGRGGGGGGQSTSGPIRKVGVGGQSASGPIPLFGTQKIILTKGGGGGGGGGLKHFTRARESWPAIADMNSVIRVIKLLNMESMGNFYQSHTV